MGERHRRARVTRKLIDAPEGVAQPIDRLCSVGHMTRLVGIAIRTLNAGERRIVVLPRGTTKGERMARQVQYLIVCDGCSGELTEGPGSARVTVSEFGKDTVRKLDLCPKCAKALPAGQEVAKPGRKVKNA